jgi:hypothetical protein
MAVKRTKKKGSGARREAEAVLAPYYTMALYADSGVGKSTLAATAPRPMILDSNYGLLSIDGRPGFEHVRRTPISSLRQLDRAYDNFTGTGTKDWSRYKTAVFDHFDDIQGQVLDDLSKQTEERDPRRAGGEISQRDWGIMGNKMRRLLRQYKALPMHKILILSVGVDKETEKLVPQLQGGLRNQLPYYCDFIAYLRIGKGGKRYLHLDGTDRFLAKCRPWWWSERKMEIPFDDTKFLTTFFERVAAGAPKNSSTTAADTEES